MRTTNAEMLLPAALCTSVRRHAGYPAPCGSTTHPVRDEAADNHPTTPTTGVPGTPGKGGAPTGRPVLLACGNPLRQDDGVGWRIAEAVERAFPGARLRIIAVQQWTPELAEEIAGTELAIFVDASATDEAGAIRVRTVSSPGFTRPVPQGGGQGWGTRTRLVETHQLEPAGLLALAKQVCGHAPVRAFVVTVGAGSFQYSEEISGKVRQAVPRAVRLVGNLVAAFAPEA